VSVAETAQIQDNQSNLTPLSLNQEFLCGFDRGDDQGPFGPRFHIVHGWRLRGEVDLDTLRGALYDVVARHEALRTMIVRDEPVRYQKVFPPAAPEIEIRALPGTDPADRDREVEQLIIDVESSTISARTMPLLRAVLGRFDEQDSVLVLIFHHTATDGWSVRLIIRDLATCYAARRGFDVPALPEPSQYREFASWQRAAAANGELDASCEFWRDKLRGARIFSIPTDRPKSANLPESTSVYRFLLGAGLAAPALELSAAMRSTPFMVLMAAFKLLVHRLTGATDIVVPTFSPGRGHEQFQDTVGPFLNFLPLRTDIGGCRTFREVVNRIRATCLEAYSYDIPFGQIVAQAPGLMEPTLEDGRAACVIQVFPFPFLLDGTTVGDLAYTEFRRRLRSQPVGSDVPNGALWTLNLDPSGDIVASIQFNSNLFDEQTLIDMVSQFRSVLQETVTAPDEPLRWS
jgi:condensation enzyme